MWKSILLTSILASMIFIMPLSKTNLMISDKDTPAISNLDPEFDVPNVSELDFSDFSVDADEVARIQRAIEFSFSDRTDSFILS
jgi:hypothetical protein